MIRDTQRALVQKEVLQSKLREGISPSALVIDQLVQEAFRVKPEGVPRFTYREMPKGQVSSVEEYNALFKELGFDLEVAFEENRYLNNRLMAVTSYYETERRRINKELARITEKTKWVQMKQEAATNTEVVGDTLQNFLHIDFQGNEKRNIPQTNAFVDLVNSNVQMIRVAKQTIKHDLTKAKLNFYAESPEFPIIHLTPVESAMQDTIYDSWRAIVINKLATNLNSFLDAELPEPVPATNVSIDTQVGNPVFVTLFLSKDGKVFLPLERRKIINTYQWNFERQEVKAIRFQFEKKEEDRANGSDYEYLFGAKNITLMEEKYMDKSYFVSQPFDLPDHEDIEKVSLEIDDLTPAGTNIRYYVGRDYDDNVIEWEELRKDRPIVSDQIKSRRIDINKYTPGYGKLINETFGQNFHAIATLPHRPLKKSMKLMIGRNMWLRETIPAPFTHDANDDTNKTVYQTSVKDWVRIGTPKKEYVRVNNRVDYLQKDTFQRYTTFIYMDDPQNYRAIISTGKNSSHIALLNGAELKLVGGNYNLSLQKGWNKLQVYAYAQDIGEEIVLDFFTPQMSSRIYADKNPLQQVSMYDMLNNTNSRLNGRFAVDENNNVVVNYHPRIADVAHGLTKPMGQTLEEAQNGVQLAEGVEYTLQYKYSLRKERHHKLRFMGILTKEKERIETTPSFKGYKLIVE